MTIKVGTFNVNNLFSRFNFKASLGDATQTITETGETRFTLNGDAVTLRTFDGKVVKEKPAAKRKQVADRIKAMDLDVLAVQEVEDIDTLKNFVTDDLGGLYPYVTLIEGNDHRLIDVAVLSKLPFGAVTSWKHAVHPAKLDELVFSRDLLQLEIMDEAREKVLFTMFVNHLKSQLVLPDSPPGEAEENVARRTRQAESIVKIVKQRVAANAPYLICGDMNDEEDSPALAPFAGLEVVNALADAAETQPFTVPAGDTPPTKPWTERYKAEHVPGKYSLFDQIWLSPSLAATKQGAFIGRRHSAGGDGSDHDPAWVVLDV